MKFIKYLYLFYSSGNASPWVPDDYDSFKVDRPFYFAVVASVGVIGAKERIILNGHYQGKTRGIHHDVHHTHVHEGTHHQ